MEENYNIEDTANLIVKSRRRTWKKAIPLTAITLACILSVAGFVGYKAIADKKYDNQIKIAEKELKEGNYVQAETEYLTAISMNNDRVDAHKGLAITYAIEEKYDDANAEYLSLYEQTKETIYKDAADEVLLKRIPMISDVFPSDSIWVEVKEASVVEYDNLKSFLDDYLSFNSFISMYDRSGNYIKDYSFNYSDPANSYAFPAAHLFINEKLYPEYNNEVQFVYDQVDPRGWADSPYFQIINKEVLEKVYTELFNVDPNNIDIALQEAEKRRIMYLDGSNYYEFGAPRGIEPIICIINKCMINGDQCIVEYDAYNASFATGELENFIDTYYALMKIKTINGNPQWTMMYNGKDASAAEGLVQNTNQVTSNE